MTDCFLSDVNSFVVVVISLVCEKDAEVEKGDECSLQLGKFTLLYYIKCILVMFYTCNVLYSLSEIPGKSMCWPLITRFQLDHLLIRELFSEDSTI